MSTKPVYCHHNWWQEGNNYPDGDIYARRWKTCSYCHSIWTDCEKEEPRVQIGYTINDNN